jgi:hypothetical protein
MVRLTIWAGKNSLEQQTFERPMKLVVQTSKFVSFSNIRSYTSHMNHINHLDIYIFVEHSCKKTYVKPFEIWIESKSKKLQAKKWS